MPDSETAVKSECALNETGVGKILCGQRDTSVVAVTSPNGGPVQSERVVVPATDPIEAARVYQKFMSGD
jgi:hypothetical protein